MVGALPGEVCEESSLTEDTMGLLDDVVRSWGFLAYRGKLGEVLGEVDGVREILEEKGNACGMEVLKVYMRGYREQAEKRKWDPDLMGELKAELAGIVKGVREKEMLPGKHFCVRIECRLQN